MMGDHQRFARLSDNDLADIATSMRLQGQGNASSIVIAIAIETIVKRRCEVQDARRQSNPVRVGVRLVQRLAGWASTRASVRIDAALGRPQS